MLFERHAFQESYGGGQEIVKISFEIRGAENRINDFPDGDLRVLGTDRKGEADPLEKREEK